MALEQTNTTSSTMSLKPQHPLHQIATTPTHKLLLKQWLKEQELVLTRISHKETQIDWVRKELTTLYIIFFTFHSLSLTLLFSSSMASAESCYRMWVPAVVSVLFSVGLVWAVRYKSDVEGHLEKLLEREREDKSLLEKCVDELKRKGCEFDLLKEVDALRRAKSLRVGDKSVRKWSPKDLVSMFLFGTSCCVVGIMRMVLCG